MASASSSSDNATKETPNPPDPVAATMPVTLPNVSQNSQNPSKVCRVVPSSFGNPTNQPSTALRFPSGLAIDHENYPKLVSIPWPIVLDQQKNYLLVINRPSLDTPDAKNTGQANSISVTQLAEDTSTFKWDCPPAEIKDPVVRAPGQKAPMCASSNGFTDSSGVNGITSNPTLQPRAPPPLIKPNARPVHIQRGVSKRPKPEHVQTSMSGGSLLSNNCSNSKLSDDTAMIRFLEQKHLISNQPNCGMVDSPATSSISLSQELQPCPRQEVSTRDNPNLNLEHAKVDQTLLDKFARIKNVHFSLRQREDNTQDIQTNGTHTSSYTNQVDDTSLASSSNAHSGYPSGTSLGHEKTTGSSGNIPSGPSKSSTELELVQGEQQANHPAVKSSQQVLDEKTSTDYNRFEDEAGVTERTDGARSEDECIIVPSLSNSSSPSSDSGGQPLSFGTGSKEDNVRKLVARIRCIRSKLHRAECDQRKRMMLKAMIGLRRQVRALTEGMRKAKKEDLATQQKVVSESPESSSGRNIPDVNDPSPLQSSAITRFNQESRDNDVIHNKALHGNKYCGRGKPPSEGSVSTDGENLRSLIEREAKHTSEVQQHCKDLRKAVSLQDFERRDFKIMKQVELPSNSDSEESIARITCNNVSKPEGGKLSELKSSRTEAPPSEIGLTTCSKRSFRLVEVCENELEMEDSIISKKMKRLPSSENGDNTNETFCGTSGMKPRPRSVTQGEVTKDLVPNEMKIFTKGNVSPCEESVCSEDNEQEHFNGLAEDFSDGSWENFPAVTPDTTVNSLSHGIINNFKDSVTQEEYMSRKKVPTFVTKYEVEEGSAFSSYFQDAQSVTQDAVVSEATLLDEMKEEQAECSFLVDQGIGISGASCSNGNSSFDKSTLVNQDVKAEESAFEHKRTLPLHKFFDHELQYAYNASPFEDNDNDQELNLSHSTPEEQRGDQSSISASSHNISETQEDHVDLMQSLEIRQIRITNLAEKRDKLFNLLMNRM